MGRPRTWGGRRRGVRCSRAMRTFSRQAAAKSSTCRRPDAFSSVHRITAGQVSGHYRIPVILGRRGPPCLSASPRSRGSPKTASPRVGSGLCVPRLLRTMASRPWRRSSGRRSAAGNGVHLVERRPDPRGGRVNLAAATGARGPRAVREPGMAHRLGSVGWDRGMSIPCGRPRASRQRCVSRPPDTGGSSASHAGSSPVNPATPGR
jgi:hypothetical protein